MMPESTNYLNGSQVRVLVVDAEAHDRQALVRSLTLIGYRVTEACSADAALKLLKEKPFDLIVLDLQKPGQGGMQLMHQIQGQWPNLLLIVITASPSLESAIMAIRTGAVDYLCKPVKINEVIDSITGALQKRTMRIQKEYLVNTIGKAIDLLEQSEVAPETLPISAVNAADSVLLTPPLKLDRAEQRVTFVDRPTGYIKLTKGETAVLSGLMVHSDEVISCRSLIRFIWGYDLESDEAKSVIRPYISRLRHKIEDNPKSPRLICTVRGKGYLYKAVQR